MKPFYLILTLIPALLIGRTVSAQISVDEVDAGEESVTFQDKLKSIPVDVDYFSRARYKAERAAIRKEQLPRIQQRGAGRAYLVQRPLDLGVGR